MVLDISRDECKRMLRRYGICFAFDFFYLKSYFINYIELCAELEAYSSVVTALRAQGDLNKDKKKVLQDLSSLLRFSTFD